MLPDRGIGSERRLLRRITTLWSAAASKLWLTSARRRLRTVERQRRSPLPANGQPDGPARYGREQRRSARRTITISVTASCRESVASNHLGGVSRYSHRYDFAGNPPGVREEHSPGAREAPLTRWSRRSPTTMRAACRVRDGLP
ncbi:MAG: hypothetical protein ACLR8Y_10125 [Alistipes indistinctus]